MDKYDKLNDGRTLIIVFSCVTRFYLRYYQISIIDVKSQIRKKKEKCVGI